MASDDVTKAAQKAAATPEDAAAVRPPNTRRRC